ncbi:Fur family transcriptional regulator [Streptomyces sp. SPB074]|uniref:Fur family transcriptional regulator n=1 Tax=Streptomyces sp. (strain SPB074) TaxID=465543 RepID=UPI00017F1613|nr:transcriptional repressor [Streptomyces sp. SPB074]EDY45115.1 ferric uptake regulation protein [Streptomyces sp. SPB074]
MYGTTGRETRSTRQRAAVLGALRAAEDFVSAPALHAVLAAGGAAVGLTTVYRTLRLFEETGRADVMREESGGRLYRWRPPGEHRHYLVCRGCGASSAVNAEAVERWVAAVMKESGYRAVAHTLELSGVCDGCAERDEAGRSG